MSYIDDEFLAHHGILGMKWGVRRYQNKDGSLTPAGRTRYGKMHPDAVRRELYSKVKKKRIEQYGWGSQWAWDNTIGKHSKAAIEKRLAKERAWQKSPEAKELKALNSRIMSEFNRGNVEKAEKLQDKFDEMYQRFSREGKASEVGYTHNGRERVYMRKDYPDTDGRELTIAYLKDLGYNDSDAAYLQRIIRKSNKKVFD